MATYVRYVLELKRRSAVSYVQFLYILKHHYQLMVCVSTQYKDTAGHS